MSGPNKQSHSLFNIVSSLAERVPFSMGKAILQIHGLPTSLGWERTKSGIKSLNNELPDNRAAADKLLTLFEEHIRVGEKLIRNYGFQGIPSKVKFVNAVHGSLRTVQIPDTVFSQAYPLSITDHGLLKKLDGEAPVLTCIFERDEAIF